MKEKKKIRTVKKSVGKWQKEDFEFDEIDLKIMRYVLDYKSLTDDQIGELIGYSGKQVNLRRNKPAFKKATMEYLLKPIDIIISAKPEAAIKMKELLQSKNEKVVLKASENILGDDLKEKATDNKPIEVIIKYE